jgi:hypothetical protein
MEIKYKYAPSDEQLYQEAKKKAREIKSFYYNLTCYCIVIPILIYVNLTYSPEFLWFFFSMIGWGIGLAAHGMGAFGYTPFLGKDWEQRKFNELLEKEQLKNKHRHGKL